MDAVATLVGLAEMHPELEWQEITAATAALFDERGLEPNSVRLDDCRTNG
jgi:hypothetical protein